MTTRPDYELAIANSLLYKNEDIVTTPFISHKSRYVARLAHARDNRTRLPLGNSNAQLFSNQQESRYANQLASDDATRRHPPPLQLQPPHARSIELRSSNQIAPDYVGGAAARRQQPSTGYLLVDKYPPFFITFISIFQLSTFVYYALLSNEPITAIGPQPFSSKLIFNPYRRYEVWRYLTYMFVHAGYWHIAFNIIIQLAVGIPLELVHGFTPMLTIYCGGVIGGALGNSIVDPYTYLAGASGGCYALVAAHVSNLILNFSEINNACCKLILLLTMATCDLYIAMYERHYKLTSYRARVSYGAHLAGAYSGLLLGFVYLRNVRVYLWEQEVKRWALVVFIASLIYAIFFSIVHYDYFPIPDKRDMIWTSNPYSVEREYY